MEIRESGEMSREKGREEREEGRDGGARERYSQTGEEILLLRYTRPIRVRIVHAKTVEMEYSAE